jgi:hypothetical protein
VITKKQLKNIFNERNFTQQKSGTMFVPGIDSLKNFGANVLALFCKLDRFSSMGKILNTNEVVQLTKMGE